MRAVYARAFLGIRMILSNKMTPAYDIYNMIMKEIFIAPVANHVIPHLCKLWRPSELMPAKIIIEPSQKFYFLTIL